MSDATSVLYDHPGPKALRRYRIFTVVFGVILLAIIAYIILKFQEKGQWDGELWSPFLQASTWTQYILPGLWVTIQTAFVSMILALIFGILFAVGRLSEHKWISVPAGAIVEFFRAVPLLLMIFFIFFALPYLTGSPFPVFWAVAIGLTLYNGSVLAEAFRSGIKAIPKGQTEAAYALGLRKNGVMRYILIPQATRLMLPVIVGQLVVLLKDTALGYIVALPELMQKGVNDLSANYGNVVAAAIVVAAIYIVINMMLTQFANYLDRRGRRLGATRPDEEGLPEPGFELVEPQG